MDLLSERLLYQKMKRDEFPDYAKWYMHAEVMRYITGRALNLQETRARFEKALETNERYPELGLYFVRIKADQNFMGIAKLVYLDATQAEVGYGMLPEFWGRGYASEILQTMIHHAAQLPQIKALIAVVDPENLASRKVLHKSHFDLIEKREEQQRPTEYYRLKLK